MPYHPAPEPKWPLPLASKALAEVFSLCADFTSRAVRAGDGGPELFVCWIDGLVDGRDVAEEVLRPLADVLRFSGCRDEAAAYEAAARGGIWAGSMKCRESTDGAVEDLASGCCAVVFDSLGKALTFEVKTSNSRSVSLPTVEKSVKGAKDAFVETLRTNTSLVRRKMRTPALKLVQRSVGRKSSTAVAVMYVEGVANPDTLEMLLRRLDDIDVDGLVFAGGIEQYVTDRPSSPFPMLIHTERPDRFASELLGGRIGLIADGLPMGFLLPATLPHFMKVSEDKAQHYLVASALTLLRWISLVISLLFPAVLVASAMYHQEMIPSKLLLSMIEAKQKVPFSTTFEVVVTMLAFELLLEAGVRLPDPVGDTVSIIGALIVGESAVEARIVSPISVIVVATAAICGFAQPSRDMGAALRLLRFAGVILAATLGVFGITLLVALTVWYLAGLESFGVAYISPLSEGGAKALASAFLRLPLKSVKLREGALKTPDRRNQR